MKLNKNIENGLLLAFYLARHGQSNLKNVSKDLKLSIHFLEQIARKLRLCDIVTSVKGPGGGYVLNPTTTALDVVTALGYNTTPTTKSVTAEGDALNNLLCVVSEHQNAVLSQTITDLSVTSSHYGSIVTTQEVELNVDTANI